MKVKQTKQEDGSLILHATATAAEVADALDKAQLSFAHQMSLPIHDGSPIADVAERELGIKDLDSMVQAQAIEYLGPFAVENKGIVPLYPPEKPSGKSPFKRGSAFEFEVSVTPKPIFKLTSYEPIAVTVEPFTIDPDEVERELHHAADSYARFVPVDPRPVQSDDCCLIDMKATLDGEPLDNLSYEGLTYVMDAGYMPPGFDESVKGMNVGETKTFTVDVPKYDSDGESNSLECTVTVKGIQKRVLPEMTDEWVAENIPPHKSLADFKKDTEARLEQENRRQYDTYLRQAVASELAKRFEDKIPDGAFKAMQETMINRMRMELQQQGMTLEDYIEQAGGQQQFQMMLLMETRENLVQGYALDAVFQHEGLTLSDEDMDTACSALNPQDPKAVYEQMMQSGRGFALREMAERMKASRWLVEHANIETASLS